MNEQAAHGAVIQMPAVGQIVVQGAGGRELIAISPDGTVTGTVEDAGPAGVAFIDSMRDHLATWLRPLFSARELARELRQCTDMEAVHATLDRWVPQR